MKNYVGPGRQVKFTATVAIESGEPVQHGNLFGVSLGKYAIGDEVILERFGIFDLSKDTTEAIEDKADLYFDAANKRVTALAKGIYIGQANGAATASATTVQAFVFGKGEGGDSGGSLSLIAPAGGVTANNGYIIGSMFVVALEAADAGDPFEAKVSGVANLAKNNGVATTLGQELFWNDTADELTPTSASGLYSVGLALEAKSSSDTTQSVHLTGAKVTAV